jgi:hypothetical protein
MADLVEQDEAGLASLPVLWYTHFARQTPYQKGLDKNSFDELVVR